MNITMLIVVAVVSVVALLVLSFYELYGSCDEQEDKKKRMKE